MNYIINPSWFYWLGVANVIKVMACIFIFFCVVGAIVVSGCAGVEYDKDDDEYKALMKWRTVFVVIALICLLLTIFVPSKTTLIEMQVARYATYENAQWTVESIKSAVDYIIEAVKSMR